MSPKIIPLALITLMLTSCSPFWKRGQQQPTPNASTPPITVVESVLDSLEETNPPFGTKAVRMGSNVNTAYSDFAPFRYGDRLYFSSTFIGEKGAGPVNHVFSSINSTGATPWSENSKEPDIHTTDAIFSPDGQRVFYTLCKEKTAGEEQVCEIYTRERAYEGNWLPFRRLPKSINLEGYTNTHPCIGFNRALRQDALYFASNRPGGMGGMDIWCSPVERNGTYGKPFPLPFNTTADEVTPFFHQQKQVLYFSSNRAGSESGFDIYKSANALSGSGENYWSVPERLDKPFNSRYDDLYFIWHASSGKAYFSSNRPGSTGHDIFEADVQTELVAQVFDALDSSMVMGCKLQLHQLADETAAALPGFTVGAETKFFLEPEKKYRLIANAIGYQPDTLEVGTNQVDVFTPLRRPIYLKPKARLLVRTFNAIDSLPLGGVALQLGYESSGEKVFMPNSEAETEHSFLIGVGDVISLLAMKPGFVTTYFKPNADYRHAPSPDAHLSVYLSPFTEAPVALYFDNNEPKWTNPMDVQTKVTYEQTYQNYLARKDFIIEKSREGLPAEEAETAKYQMASFFENEVQTNHDRLDRLCAQLATYLQKGYHLEVLAVGEASPLASTDYNQRLIERRISTVVNQLKTWQNGTLNPYFANGQLLVSSEVKLMENQGEKVQVKLTDRRQAEFSPEAAMMRKVVITKVKRQLPKA